MFYKKKKNKYLSFETFNLLRSHTECGVLHTRNLYYYIYIYLFINFYFYFL